MYFCFSWGGGGLWEGYQMVEGQLLGNLGGVGLHIFWPGGRSVNVPLRRDLTMEASVCRSESILYVSDIQFKKIL